MGADTLHTSEKTQGGCRIPPERFRKPTPRAAIAQHVTMRVADSRVIAPSAAARRIAARTFIETGDLFGLLGFRVVDSHAHAVVACPRSEAGEFARRVEIALRARLGIGCAFDPARLKPVLDQWHLENTIRYILDQERHHGISLDPAHDGSSLPDLCRWRVVAESLAERVRTLVPRLAVTLPLSSAELQATAPVPSLLTEAAAAAFALPVLDGSSPLACIARRAAVRVGEAERIRRSVVADLLRISRRRAEQIAAGPQPEPRMVYAVRAQLRFRSALATRPR